MDKYTILQKFLNKKEAKDYTYAVLFFVLSSIFAIFAIKPALSIAFNLTRKVSDLRHVNEIYEKNLNELVDLQTQMQKVQDKSYLLDDAIPHMPDTKVLIDDIKRSASQEGILINKLNLEDLDLKNNSTTKVTKLVTINMETITDYKSVQVFLKNFLDQRRLKNIRQMKITTDEESVSSDSSKIRIQLEIEGYYL